MKDRERVEVRKTENGYHYVHIANNNEILTTSEVLDNRYHAIETATKLAEQLGVKVVIRV